jgi:hypothetical protein
MVRKVIPLLLLKVELIARRRNAAVKSCALNICAEEQVFGDAHQTPLAALEP